MKVIGDHLKQILPHHNRYSIYTDGSHKQKWGSWSFVVVQKNKIIYELSGRARKTNSHRMEFQAAIEALKFLKKGTRADFYCDSKVLIDCFSFSGSRPRTSGDQLQEIDALLIDRVISRNWVKAHSGEIYNERCDKLCVLARDS